MTGSIEKRFENELSGAIAWSSRNDLALGGLAEIQLSSPSRSVSWSLDGHREAREKDAPTVILDLAYSPDGNVLASVGNDHEVLVWDTGGNECAPLFGIGGAKLDAQSVAFSPDSASLAVCGPNGPVQIWSVPDGKRVHDLDPEAGQFSALTYLPTGELVMCGKESTTLTLISPQGNVSSGPQVLVDEPHAVAATADGSSVAVTGRDEIAIWNRNSDDVELLDCLDDRLSRPQWSPDGSTLYGINIFTGVNAWSESTGWRAFELP